MASSKLNPKSVARWLRHIAATKDSVVQLHAEVIGDETSLISEWLPADNAQDVEAWADEICEMARSDAEARGQSTRYVARHVRDGRTYHSHPLRVVLPRETDEEESKLDGTTTSFVMQCQRAMERSLSMVHQMAGAAVNTQQGVHQLLAQSYKIIEQQARKIAELEERLARRERREQRAGGDAEDGDSSAFDAMVATMLPAIAKKMGLDPAAAGGNDAARKVMLAELGLPENTDLRKVGQLMSAVLQEESGSGG